MTRQVNQAGLDLVKLSEGLILTAYLDAVSIPTIGYGHTRDVHMGDVITQDEAEALLRFDLGSAEKCVEEVCPGLTDNRFAACVSLAFNIGCGAFQNSTLVKLIHAEDYPGAAMQFLRWDHAGGKVLAGLTERRGSEMRLFLTPESP